MPGTERPLFIPVMLGTPRQGRRSEHPAHLVLEETKKRAGVETELIDVRSLHMRLDDAGEEMKDPAFAATVAIYWKQMSWNVFGPPGAAGEGKRYA